MEKIRNAHFKFHMYADPALDPDETMLPPMLIQPFLENAIWHGMTGNSKEIQIDVLFTKQDEQMRCTIDDNGIGIQKAIERKKTTDDDGHHSMGISNIRNRIDLLNKKYQHKSSIVIADKSTLNGSHDTGTRVTIILPLNIEITS
jgi:sensor histidine kinase YesM